ncbi:hypothetical protein BJ138DRAFT_1098787 [Hygrophoropsis aurantiaca]|uniref:Uncharacterized protein n=1 Tax=Hygrophoropsis aurantiaca TaxID=72124 RepID=A0ACB8AMV3_9AGAM|nr:hypothetical protein BJ138DRAFT_1098787 [Hygrophoropsis aurantiaca]
MSQDVASHAVAILLRWTLETSKPRLGLRVSYAEKMEFKYEGKIRWAYAMPAVEGYPKVGLPSREGDPKPDLLGRDSSQYVICWDDWEKKGKDTIYQSKLTMKRLPVPG